MPHPAAATEAAAAEAAAKAQVRDARLTYDDAITAHGNAQKETIAACTALRRAIENKMPAPAVDEARERYAAAGTASHTADEEMIKAQHAFNEAVQKMMNAHQDATRCRDEAFYAATAAAANKKRKTSNRN